MTQQSPTILRIRELILRGALAPGERVREVHLAERLGLSRTPVRNALPSLAQEGLLVPWGARGYAVRRFSRQESLDALRTRAALEGLAARAAIERGGAPDILPLLDALLDEGDRLLRASRATDEIELAYGGMNERFHDAIVRAAGAPLLVDLIARCNVVPFAGPGNIAFEGIGAAEIATQLQYAHRQHHAIVDALRQGDAARVEFLFREHAVTQELTLRRPPG